MGDTRFSISGTVHGDVQQSAGDIHSIKVSGAEAFDALSAAGQLRAAIASLDLVPDTRRSAEAELGHIERELSSLRPDRTEVARRLERFTAAVKAAGALATAGAALAGPVGVIAGWLGPVGATALRLMR
jgi:hypothetical protein